MYPSEDGKEPSGGDILNLFSQLVGQSLIVLLKLLSESEFDGRIDHQAEGHDQ